MRITVAICTWNRCQLLARTLDQMTGLRVPAGLSWEVLVINNGSCDATAHVVDTFASRLPIRQIVEDHLGLSRARNRALEHARGDYILWTDDDVLVDQHWLIAFLATAGRFPEGAVIGGPIEPWFPVAPDPMLLATFECVRVGFCGIDHGGEERCLESDEYVWGANMAFRKAAIDGLCFDDTLGVCGRLVRVGEEKDFIKRVRRRGGSVIWSPAMRVRHHVDPSRVTRGYVARFTAARGRLWIHEDGVPAGVRLFGAPRWLWREYVTSFVKYAASHLSPRPQHSLAALRRYAYLRGAIQECRFRGGK
jgi:glycosyltransferase involved in cell wall biosynthesis